ncbi:hypothetical protein PRIC2_014068 [Phytophthora ramorum]
MPSNRFAVNPYPELHVSEEERTQLIELVDGFVQDYFQKYEDFVVVDKQKVDEQRWKHVKTKDSQHVYAERSGKEKRDAGVVSWNPENAKDGATPKKDLPVVLSVGALVGDLDDLMFGVVNPTLDVMRIKASYWTTTLSTTSGPAPQLHFAFYIAMQDNTRPLNGKP